MLTGAGTRLSRLWLLQFCVLRFRLLQYRDQRSAKPQGTPRKIHGPSRHHQPAYRRDLIADGRVHPAESSTRYRDGRKIKPQLERPATSRVFQPAFRRTLPETPRGLRPAACEVCLDVRVTTFLQSLTSSSGSSNGHGDLDRVGLCPDSLSAAEVKTVHCSLQMASIHFDEEVVVVNLLALEGVTGSAFDGIGVSSCSP